jgi:hypothetical protein
LVSRSWTASSNTVISSPAAGAAISGPAIVSRQTLFTILAASAAAAAAALFVAIANCARSCSRTSFARPSGSPFGSARRHAASLDSTYGGSASSFPLATTSCSSFGDRPATWIRASARSASLSTVGIFTPASPPETDLAKSETVFNAARSASVGNGYSFNRSSSAAHAAPSSSARPTHASNASPVDFALASNAGASASVPSASTASIAPRTTASRCRLDNAANSPAHGRPAALSEIFGVR